jgi:pimeloyl-ACP methyl ester carboxylesterase
MLNFNFMKSTKINNTIYTGANSRKSLTDLEIPENFNNKVVVFMHGYMGFKDWGCWNIVQSYFVKQGFGFCKYNVSHNGGTISDPIDFPDLDAFSNNTYYKELTDLLAILGWIENNFEKTPEIYLVGHSRGGGIALLGSMDKRVKKIVTWAGISDIARRFPNGEELLKWKNDGVKYTVNMRTRQKMPLSFIQYEEFDANRSILNIEQACRKITIPSLIIHGTSDTSVDISEGRQLARWLNQDLTLIENASHTFGASHPWQKEELPNELKQVCDKTIEFLLKSQ